MLSTLQDIQVEEIEGIFYYLNDKILSKSDWKELIAHQTFEDYRTEKNQDDTFDAIVFRSPTIQSFQKLIPNLDISGHETILEMGGGFCWASALLKREYPQAYVVGSDLIHSNLKFTVKFEKILHTHLNEKWVFNSRYIPFVDGQFDRIFTFAAFHHFGENNDFSQTLQEMIRILKPQGKIILLFEPSSPRYLYQWAFNRVNKNPYADEDILILSHLQKYVHSLNCHFSAQFYPDYHHRGIAETIYYYTLNKLGILQKLLPCTVNIVIQKN